MTRFVTMYHPTLFSRNLGLEFVKFCWTRVSAFIPSTCILVIVGVWPQVCTAHIEICLHY
jgi:hypothetical protein